MKSKENPQKKRVKVVLPVALLDAVRGLSAATGSSFSGIVEAAVGLYVEEVRRHGRTS